MTLPRDMPHSNRKEAPVSANEPQDQQQDPKIELLRNAGHIAAADMLEAAAEMDARRAAQQARDDAQRSAGPPGRPASESGLRLLPGHPFDDQREQEGRAIRDALQRSGVGRPHGSAALFPGLGRGGQS